MYITSQFRNRGSIQYRKDTTRKMEKLRSEVPGPGSYIAPSDFGHLDVKPTDIMMSDFLNAKINNDITPRKVREPTSRSHTSQGMRSTRMNSQQ